MTSTPGNYQIEIVNRFVEDGFINQQQGQSALEALARGDRPRKALREQGITHETYVSVVSLHYRIPYMDVSQAHLQPGVLDLIPAELAHKYRVLPLELSEKGILRLAIEDLLDKYALTELRTAIGKKLKICISTQPLTDLIQEFYPQNNV